MWMCLNVIPDDSFKIAERHGFIDRFAIAAAFAKMPTYTATGSWKRTALADEIIGLSIFAGSYESHRTLHIDSGRTTSFARRLPGRLGDSESIGYRLRIGPEYRLSRSQATVKLVWKADGANFGASAAGITFLNVYVARILSDLDLEASGLTGDTLDICQRNYFYVSISGAFNQLGR